MLQQQQKYLIKCLIMLTHLCPLYEIFFSGKSSHFYLSISDKETVIKYTQQKEKKCKSLKHPSMMQSGFHTCVFACIIISHKWAAGCAVQPLVNKHCVW